MSNNIVYENIFNQFKESLKNGNFAKLTFAKTIGNTLLMNIYIRTIIVDEKLMLCLKFKYQQEEIIENHDIEMAEKLLFPYLNNPFLTVLLFTTNSDVTLKLNKKRVATISEKEPTFKNADPVLLEYLAK